jgi:zinc/manganese transport system ATP-binding protein
MANFFNRVRRLQSLSDVVSAARTAAAPLGGWLAFSFLAVARSAQAAFSRHFDSGYDPSPSSGRLGGAREGIVVRNLSVRYGERYAFENLTGEFAAASLTAVIGPNGAGKSSLLKVLAGVIRPTSGEVICSALPLHRLAYLPQQDELDREFPITVAELVALGAWRNFGSVRKVPPGLAASVHEAVAAVGLLTVIDRPIAELSVGQFQRALFARLLLQDADVILLDEPFASLDENTTEDLLQFLRRWRQEGRAVVAVLHDLDRVRQYFPSTLLLARVPIAWGDTSISLAGDNLARARKTVGPADGRIGRAA